MNTEKETQFKLPASDMAFRKIYKVYLENEMVTTVFRPGKRDCHKFRGYCPKDIVNARVIEHQGLDRARLAPIFLDSPVKEILIEKVLTKSIREISDEDFIGALPDIHDKQSLIYHLGLIYDLDLSSLSEDAIITKIDFIYIH